MKNNYILSLLLLVSFNISAETPAEIYKNESRVFDSESNKVKEAILNFHRDRNYECYDGYLTIRCQGKGEDRKRKYTYNLKELDNDRTEVILIIPDSLINRLFSTDAKEKQNHFNAIEKQLVRDIAPSTPANVEGKNTSPIIPLTNSDFKETESRRFSYSLTLVQEGVSSYFAKEKRCGGVPNGEFTVQYSCEAIFLGISMRGSYIYNVEYRKVDDNITDIRIKVDGLENHEKMFKAIFEHIKYLSTK